MFFTSFILNKKWYPIITIPFYFLTLGLFIFISVYFNLFDTSKFNTNSLKIQLLYFFGIYFPLFFNILYFIFLPRLKRWYSKNSFENFDNEFIIFVGYWLYLIILKYYLILICLTFYVKTMVPLIIISLMDIWIYIIFFIVSTIKKHREKKRRELEAGLSQINDVFTDSIQEL